jgi:glycosyltransferase involved in cell wall biosynthesis
MRVLAVTTWFPTPSHPAVGAFVVKDTAAIAGLGHDVQVVHLAPPHQLAPGDLGRHEAGGLPVTRIAMSTSHPGQIAAAGREVRELATHADLVHTMAFSTLLPTAGWRSPVPWVHTEHWSGLTAPRTLPVAWRLLLPGLTPLLRAPDVVTAVCDYLADPIRAVRRHRPTHVVPCIVPVPEPVPARPAEDGETALVGVGALVEGKDPVLAVEVVHELARRGHPARLTLVGQGELEGSVRHRAAELGLSDQVVLTGVLDAEGVRRELASADLFLGPTRGDNFFVSCAEALVAGRPVVVGTGGQKEYIDPRVGRTVDRQHVGAYADAVLDVLETTRGLTAQDISGTVGRRFSVEVVADGYQAAYDLAVELHQDAR